MSVQKSSACQRSVCHLLHRLVSSPYNQSYLKDLKPSNVQDADEGGPLSLSAVQSSIDAVH